MERPQETTALEKVELQHKAWKEKQEAVPESDEDLFLFRHEDGREIKTTRKEYMETFVTPPGFIFESVVKLTLGEAEKNAKGGD